MALVLFFSFIAVGAAIVVIGVMFDDLKISGALCN